MFKVKTIAASIIATGLLAAAIPASAAIGTTVETRIPAAQLQTQQGVISVYEYLESVATEACEAKGVSTLADRRSAATCAENLFEEFIESEEFVTAATVADQILQAQNENRGYVMQNEKTEKSNDKNWENQAYENMVQTET